MLIRAYEPEVQIGVIEIPAHVRNQMATVEQRAIVVEVGAHCWPDEPAPRAKAGDRVLVAKFAGHMAQGVLDGQPYRLVNDRDIFAQITAEKGKEAENG